MRNQKLVTVVLAIFTLCHVTLYAQNEKLQQQVDKYLSAYEQMNLFSGVVLIANHGNVQVCKGYGEANCSFDIRNIPNTKFRIGSLTKAFTAIAILQLVEQGKLTLDDKLSSFLSDYPRGDEITVRNLLTHTSGISNHTDFDDFENDRRVYPYTLIQTINTFKNKPLNSNPGEKSEYSNSNYILLGFILEKVSQMKYEDFVQQFILDPLDMKNTGYERPEKVIKQFASGYVLRNNELQKAQYRNMANAHASGALYSTVNDLYLLDRALYNNSLLSEKSRKLMATPYKGNLTCGWGVAEVFDHAMIGLMGEIDGYRANISRFLSDDICIIILSNIENTPLNQINLDLIAMTFGEHFELPEVAKIMSLPDTVLQSYAGNYELKPGFNFRIVNSNGRCFCQPTGQPKLELLAISENEFMVIGVPAHIAFEFNSQHEVEKLILKQGGREIPALKVK